MSAPFDRPTTEPGGCACDECGVVFIGAEGHQRCAICHARHEAAIAALQAILKPLGTNLRHYEAYAREPAIEAMKAAMVQGWRSIGTAPKDGTVVLIWNSEGMDLARWGDAEPDGPDSMGHDAGWWGLSFAVPGRSFGNPDYMRDPQGQPSLWQPIAAPGGAS